MDLVEVVHTSVFAAEHSADGGNPCPVILAAGGLTDAQLQAVARRYGQECGFVVSDVAGQVPTLRFFVPEHEMTMCVHATAACTALLVAADRLRGEAAVVQTPIGRLRVEWRGSRPMPGKVSGLPEQVSVDQLVPTRVSTNPDPAAVAQVLSIDVAELGLELGPVESWSASRAKLIVPVRDAGVLHGLSPDWAAMWDLCAAFGTAGVYAIAPGVDSTHWYARQFPVRAGYPEDAATGVAAAALAGYFVAAAPPRQPGRLRYDIAQGKAMGRPSSLSAVIDWDGTRVTRVRVAGTVQVQRTEVLSIGELGTA